MVALGVSVTAHLLVVGAAIALGVPFAVRAFIPDRPDAEDRAAAATGGRAAFAAWREPRTLLVGVFVLAFAFAEGAGNDWIGVAMIDGHGADAAVGTLAFAVFLSAMTAGRWFGPGLLDTYGRVPVIRALDAHVRRRAACSSRSPRARRWRSPGPCCGASGSRSGSPSA